MKGIFISYRRSENPALVGRIYDKLCSEFGRDLIFLDVDSIPLGVDFRAHLESQVRNCSVFVSVIGPQWHKLIERLHDKDDFVAIETAEALRSGRAVIPLLVNVQMPSQDDLPAEIKDLAFQNGMPLDDGRDFHAHMTRFVDSVARRLGNTITSKSLGVLLDKVIEDLDKKASTPGTLLGVPSGITELDRLTGGFRRGSVYAFAARPRMGLTSLITVIADAIGCDQGRNVLWIDSDRNEEITTLRMLVGTAKIPLERLEKGILTRDESQRLSKAAARLYSSKLRIAALDKLTTDEIARHVESVNEAPPDLVIVDSITPIKGSHEPGFYMQLAHIARSANVPVICTHTLRPKDSSSRSRSNSWVEMSPTDREMMSAFDFIALLTRCDYSLGSNVQHEKDRRLGWEEALLCVAQNKRVGGTGDIHLWFHPEFLWFTERHDDK